MVSHYAIVFYTGLPYTMLSRTRDDATTCKQNHRAKGRAICSLIRCHFPNTVRLALPMRRILQRGQCISRSIWTGRRRRETLPCHRVRDYRLVLSEDSSYAYAAMLRTADFCRQTILSTAVPIHYCLTDNCNGLVAGVGCHRNDCRRCNRTCLFFKTSLELHYKLEDICQSALT